MEASKNRQFIPLKSKIQYKDVLNRGINECRQKRVDDPSQGFIDAVRALELVLLPNEHKRLNEYQLDINDYSEEIEEYINLLPDHIDDEIRTDIILDKVKGYSAMTYKIYVNKLFKEKKLTDQNFDGVINKGDVHILCVEIILEKIIEILQKEDWIGKGNVDDTGGGGHGLDEALPSP